MPAPATPSKTALAMRTEAIEVTEQEFAVTVAQVHPVATTIAEVPAVGTLASTHPLTVAVGSIAVLPHLHEVILIDVPLGIVGPDAGTGGNGTVGHDGADGDASLTGENPHGACHPPHFSPHEGGSERGEASYSRCRNGGTSGHSAECTPRRVAAGDAPGAPMPPAAATIRGQSSS